MKMQFSLGHMARAMTRERLRKELPDSRLLEVKTIVQLHLLKRGLSACRIHNLRFQGPVSDPGE